MNNLKQGIISAADGYKDELIELSHNIHQNPELGMKEFKAAAWQKAILEKYGFTVEMPFFGMDTAFKAYRKFGDGVKIAFLSEYDALQGEGHACGHNIIASCSTGAALSLAKVMQDNGMAGEVALFGTPAEETMGGKIPMAEGGAFEGYACALMMHPSTENLIARHGLAAQTVSVEFFGKSAHSSKPSEGINAMTSMISLFNGIDSMRQVWPNESKINGIITHGGKASNVIPEYTRALFTVRAGQKKKLLAMFDGLKRAADAAAKLTGAEVKVHGEPIYAERYPSLTLGEAFKGNMEFLGEKMNYPDYTAQVGSSDIGNVSLVLPAIHEYLSIGDPETVKGHHSSFKEAAISARADEVVLLGAKGLAMTAIDVLTDESIRSAMLTEFNEKVKPNQC